MKLAFFFDEDGDVSAWPFDEDEKERKIVSFLHKRGYEHLITVVVKRKDRERMLMFAQQVNLHYREMGDKKPAAKIIRHVNEQDITGWPAIRSYEVLFSYFD